MSKTNSDQGVLLQLDGVVSRIGRLEFGPVSLQVVQGERIAILGPSGAGKSSLMKFISRECIPDTGQVHFCGRPLSGWSLTELSQLRAVLPQSGTLAFGLNVDLVVGLGRVARAHDPQLTEIVAASAQMARAYHLLCRRFDTLSGGEQARVQLARIFAQLWDVQGGLVLVDEPLAALDPGLQFELLDSLDRYATERNHALLAILHDINQAMFGFDRLLLVKEGKLVGDLACSPDAVPALAALYGIGLRCIVDGLGSVYVVPSRDCPSRPVSAITLP